MSAWSLAKRAFDLFVSLCDILVNTILTEVKSRFLKLMYGDVASSADFLGMGEKGGKGRGRSADLARKFLLFLWRLRETIAASTATFENSNLSDRASFESVNLGVRVEFWVDLWVDLGAGMGAISSLPELFFLPLCVNNILLEGYFDFSG